jgi:hypothetical protein
MREAAGPGRVPTGIRMIPRLPVLPPAKAWVNNGLLAAAPSACAATSLGAPVV